MTIEEMQAEQMRRFQKEYDEMELPRITDSPVREEIRVPMSDGVRLQTILYLPEEDAMAGGRVFPVILQRSPYYASLPQYEFHGRNLAAHGFIYIVQFCRGTGESEGRWEPNVNERRDGLDTLSWLQNAPWAGRIGFWGDSYLALTGWCMADAVPDKVKGMFLGVYGTDRFSSAYCKGAFRHDVLTSWAMENAGFPVEAGYDASYRFRPQIKVDEALWGQKIPWYRDWITAVQEDDPYWQQGFWKQLREIPGKVRIPLYIVEGWYDHHLGSALKSWAAISPSNAENCSLMIGSWNHPGLNCLQWMQPRDLRNSEVKPMTDWFTSLLVKGKMPARRTSVYIIGRDAWKELPAWPMPEEKTKRFALAPDGSLREAAAKAGGQGGNAACGQDADEDMTPEEGKFQVRSGNDSCSQSPYDSGSCAGERNYRTYIYDPENPVPSHGAESMLHMLEEIGSLFQPEPGWREDVLSFVSVPLREDLVIGGKVRVKLVVSSDCGDTAFTAKLMKVGTDGRAVNIRSSITSIGADHPEGYVPGTKVPVEIEMWDIVFEVKAGERLRLDVSSSDFPQYSIHSNYPGVWSMQEKTRIAHQTIWCGEGESAVEIPVLAEDAAS